MSIHLLSPEIASQIAAGEVVERPASVVKELVENALDAGATHISITVEGAGQRLIEIADNGSGIPPGELLLAVERHATSKLQAAEDLFHITTLGFRGEALASIASVSRLTLTSRPRETGDPGEQNSGALQNSGPLQNSGAEQNTGARLRVEGGIITGGDPNAPLPSVPLPSAPLPSVLQPVGAPVGTVVRVEDLFYNVPARLKFLKHETTERRQIDTLVTHYALAYPRVRFQLRQEGRPALQTTGKGERREVLAALYGVETARQMIAVLAEEDNLRVEGFISPTSLTRSHRREITFFINGRPVQDAALTAALLKAYHTLLMVGRYPVAVLFIEVPPENVDVNVHPTKAEVRFREPDRIFTGVQRAVRRALLAHTPVPGLESPYAGDPSSSRGTEWGSGRAWGTAAKDSGLPLPDDPAWGIPESEETPPPAGTGWTMEEGRWRAVNVPAPEDRPVPAPAQTPLPAGRVPLLRPVGQVASAYLVAEGPDGLYLVDQHAAHERVLFERFLAQHAAHQGPVPAQTLLQPAAVDLPPASARLLSEQLPLLEHLGFQVEPFGPGAFLVRAIPALLAGADPAAALRVLVEDFEEDETPLQAEVEARLIARVCKRAAVKAGQTLSPEEQRSLLTELEACASPRTCPHGRPTMIHLSVDLLERQFGRKGAR